MRPEADVELLRRAYVFSAFEHRGQVRHSGEPYLIHPLAVANILADMRLDAVAIAAGPAPRCRRRHADHHRSHRGAVRAGRGPRRRRRDEDQRHSVLVERRAPGRELPQDAPRHGRRHPRRRRQAGRPSAQHADPQSLARGTPHQGRPGDARHLRANRQPPRHEQGQERARRAVVPLHRARELRVAARQGRREAPGQRGADRAAEGDDLGQARRGAGPDPRRSKAASNASTASTRR